MLVLSDLHGACSVRSLALKFIVENGKEIVAQNGWRDKLKVENFSIFSRESDSRIANVFGGCGNIKSRLWLY